MPTGNEAVIAIVMEYRDNASSGIDAFKGKLGGLRSTIDQHGQSIRNAGIAMTAMGAGGLMASKSLVTSASSIEDAMANVNTMLGDGEDAQGDYGDAIDKLITQIPIAGGKVEALNGLYMTLSAGTKHGADSVELLETAMKAARGGMTDTATAVDAITTVMNAYGPGAMSAGEISDYLFSTVKAGKLNFSELAGSIGQVTAVSAQVGVGFDQVSATMATLTKAGLTSDIAATSLRATMQSFIKPSDEMAGAMEEMGYASGTAMLEELGLQGALEALSGSVDGDTEALSALFPNIRALGAVLPLTGSMASTAAADLDTMADSSGAAGDAYGKTADTTSAKTDKLAARLEIAKEKMANGATPAMLKMQEVQVQVTESMAGMNDATGGTIGAMMAYGSAALATIGPIMAMIGQLAMLRVAKAANATASGQQAAAETAGIGAKIAGGLANMKLAISQWAANAAMYANPIMIIVAAIVVCVVAIIMLVKHWDKVTAAFQEFGAWVSGGLQNAWKGINDGLSSIRNAGKKTIDFYVNMWKMFGAGLVQVKDKVVGWAKDGAKAYTDWRNSARDKAKEVLKVYGKTYNAMNKKARDSANKMKKSLIDGAKGGIAKMKGLFSGLTSFYAGLGKRFQKWGKDMMQQFQNGMESMKNKISEAVKGIGNKIKKALGFSLPEEGPLREVPVWGKDMIESFAGGWDLGMPFLKKKLASLTAGMKLVNPSQPSYKESSYHNTTTANMNVSISGTNMSLEEIMAYLMERQNQIMGV